MEASGTVDLDYTATRSGGETTKGLFTDVRPALALELRSPRLAFRVGYLFAASLLLDGTGSNSYSNALDLSLASEFSKTSTMTWRASLTQGSTAFQLSQRPPDTGEPALRAEGSQDLVTGSLGESFSSELSPQLRLLESATLALSAPQDALDLFSATLSGALGLERRYSTDAFGAVLQPSYSVLRPLAVELPQPVKVMTVSLLGSWNHDFDRRWNGQLLAGAEHAVTLASSSPPVTLPTGTLSLRYFADSVTGSLVLSHALATNLQTGTLSQSDAVTLRGVASFDATRPRELGASVGFLHARPTEATPLAAEGSADAAEVDVGLIFALWDALWVTARYSLAYEFNQAGGLRPSLVNVVLVGLTAHYSNARYTPHAEVGGAGRRRRCGAPRQPLKAMSDRAETGTHVAHILSSLGLGGQERVALDLAKGQLRAGFRVTALSLAPAPDGPLGDEFRAAGARVNRVERPRPGVNPGLFLRLTRWLRRHDVDLAHTHNRMALIYGAPAAFLARAAVVHTKHGNNPGGGSELFAARLAARCVDAFVAVSPETAAVARSRGEVALARLQVIPNGIELSRFHPEPSAGDRVRAELAIDKGAFVMGTVGRLAAEKEQALLLRALAPLLGSLAHLVVAGDGPLRTALSELAAALGVSPYVHFLGARGDVPDVLNALDAFVLSSSTEGLPLVVPEAMATGLPVVSTRVGGIPTVIDDGETGYLVPAGDEEALRRRLALLKADRELGRACGRRARAVALARFSAERMVRDYLTLYARVLSRHRPGDS